MTRFSLMMVVLVGCNGSETTRADKDDAPPLDTDGDSDTDTDTDADSDSRRRRDNISDTDPPGVDADGDASSIRKDCDDGDPAVFPGAPDICGDDRTTDCDRTTDDGLATVDGVETFGALDEALAAADAGSTVLVCPGTWVGQFVVTRPIVLGPHGGPDA